jgi:hypothetical protein
VDEARGSVHDFEILRQGKIRLLPHILMIAGKGFQGIRAVHPLSLTPFKKPRNGGLTAEQKTFIAIPL